MASNDCFGMMKKHGLTFQETAKTKLDKWSETVDKKIKEVQEDLEKQRTKTESEPTLPVTPTSEIQQTTPSPAGLVEEIVVVSRRSKRKKSSTKHTNNQAETTNTDNDVNKELENKVINDQTNTISTRFEISEDAPDNELNTKTMEIDQNQLLSTENLQSTDTVTTVPITSTSNVQNAEVENSVSEDVYNSTDEPKAEITSNETSLDESSISTYDNQLSIESTNVENTDNETSINEISTVTTNDCVPLEDSVSVEETTTSTNTDKFVEEYPVQEDVKKELSHDNYIQENISIDESTPSTKTEELIEEYPTLEDQQNDVSNDDHILMDEPRTLTRTDQLMEEQFVPEDIHKELSYDNQIRENVSIVERSTLINVDKLAKEYPVSQDTNKDVINIIDDSFISANLSVVEPLISTNTEQSTEEQRFLEADLTSEITTNDESVTEQLVSENAYEETQHDQLTTETIENFIIQLKDESQIEQYVTENVNKISSDDDNVVPVEITTQENIQVNELVDELSTDNADSSSVNSQSENISSNTLNDDFVFSTKNDGILADNFETKYIQLKTHDDLVTTDTQSDVENIPNDIPNDESSNKINPINIEPESDIDEDLSTITVVNKSSDENNTPTSNLLSNVSEDTVELHVVTSKPESITNIVLVESKSENRPTLEPDVIVSPIENAPGVKEEVKKSVEKLKAKTFLFDDSTSDDEPKVVTNMAITVVSSSIEDVSHLLTTPPVPTATYQINPFGEVDESIETNPFGEFDEFIETNPFGDVDEPTDQTNPFEEDDDDTNPFNEVKQSTSTNPFDDDINTTSSTTITRIVQPRYSVINYHPIPPGTKISQMNCSSLYIYLCTIDHELFFAKLNFSDPSQPFDWQQHDDSAERLVASVSNRTVWRFFNQCIYIANDPINYPPFGSYWNRIKIDDDQTLLSMSVNDQCGWYIKKDGTLWFLRTDDKTFQSTNIPCSYTLDIVCCVSEKVGVTTNIGEILIRVGCRFNFPEGDGWLFIEKRVGFIDDFILLTNNDIMMIMDNKHRLWMNEWSTKTDFHEILLSDNFDTKKKRYLLGVNTELLYITDCEKGIYIYSDAITGVQWNVVEKSSPYLRLFAAFSGEDYVWAITSSRLIGSSNGQILDKPDAVSALTHASFVPNNSSKKSILWALDQSCDIYIRSDIEKDTIWEQADDSQFEKKRKLLNIACNNRGVWAVDDRGNIHFRHGHISANQHFQLKEKSLLPPAWITVSDDTKQFRSFVQVFCGLADWMVYATDTKQNVYTRIGISATDRIGTAWKLIEDCSALELSISEHSLWLLTSHGHIECRENISLENSIGTRSVTLSGHFRSLAVSSDDNQVWALDSNRNLLKLDRLTVLFKK